MKHNHDCFHFDEEPAKRERPEWAGSADTTPVGDYWDVQHKPCPPTRYPDAYGVPDCGYGMPPLMPPIPPFNPNLSMPSQVEGLTCKVNDLIKTLNAYSDNVYGAYNAIVQSALCNDAYYREVTVEEGYLPDASAKYKVVHIPFVDKAGEPIYLELGLAYNNSTNSGVREKSFDASQRFLADKLIPAANVGTNWYGHPFWKNAPIPTTEVEGMKYTVGITEGGFIKWYANSVDDRTMQIDKVRNAMGVRSVLIAGGELSQNMWETAEATQLARVGIGMNYQTKERFIVVVEGSDRTGCTTEQFANIFKGYACDVAVECANGDSSYMVDKGEMAVLPSTVNAMSIPTVPDSNCFWYITKRRHYKNQYVKDVAVLTQRVGQEIWNTELADTAVDKVKAEVIDLNNRVTEEVARLDKRVDDESATRLSEDTKLAESINEETKQRKEGDNTLDARITSEVATLNARIDIEVEKLNAVDAKLREDLTAETQNRLDNDITAVELVQDGTKDIYRLKKGDGTAIEVPIELYNYTLLVQKLDTLSQVEVRLNAEIEARKAADDGLGARIDTEVADRTSADLELQTQINDNKASSDAALTQEIADRKVADAQEVADRKAADAQEVADRKQADADMDAALKALITAEETARKAGDTDLANQIGSLNSQLTQYMSDTNNIIDGINEDLDSVEVSITTLTKTVSDNKTELESKLTSLTARVAAEEVTTADTVEKIAQITSQVNALQTTISALNETVTSLQASFASTEQSFENVKQTVSSMQTELNTFEETVNSKLTELEGKYLPLAGGTMSGTLNMDATKFIDYSDPTKAKPFYTIDHNGKKVVNFTESTCDMAGIDHVANSHINYYIKESGDVGFVLTHGTNDTEMPIAKLVNVTRNEVSGRYRYQITNDRIPLSIAPATQDDEAVTKDQLDKAVAGIDLSGYLPLSGGTITGPIFVDSKANIIIGIPTGAKIQFQNNVTYLDEVGGIDFSKVTNYPDVSATLSFGNTGRLRCMDTTSDSYLPISVGDGTLDDDAVNKRQLDKMLPLAGGTMSGLIDMSSNELTNVSALKFKYAGFSGVNLNPEFSDTGKPKSIICENDSFERINVKAANGTESDDLVTKAQLDKMLPLAGGKMLGDIDMGQQAIKNAYEIGVTDAGKTHDVKLHVNDDGSLTVGTYAHGESTGTVAKVKVADGTDDTDAVNKKQLDSLIKTGSVTYTFTENTKTWNKGEGRILASLLPGTVFGFNILWSINNGITLHMPAWLEKTDSYTRVDMTSTYDGTFDFSAGDSITITYYYI